MPSFPGLPLHTSRLVLRPLAASDAAAVFAIFSDAEVMRYWSSPPWTSMEQAQAFIESDLQGLASGQHLRLGMVRQADGELIGQCAIFGMVPSSRRAEMGYSLARHAWGCGYAVEALQALLGYGFESLNLNRIEADIDPRNTRSAKALARLGFAKEGYMPERWLVGGEVSDTEFYGLLRRDWQAAARGG
ncbi:GNAT family N-acetyltransferase [Roseateles sp. BYS180W]|uniref:GNAT family N-acetyltransferase n=1 Tax=Roseateles rivi TaxID=3299028 RepID=A0ABW7FT30_9BURK